MARRPYDRTEIRSTVGGHFDALRADYDAARNDRYLPMPSGVSPMGSSADYHARNDTDQLRMMERFRAADRNNMVVGQAITRLIRNVIQDGMRLDPSTGSDDLDRENAARWKTWCDSPDDCDSAGEHTFTELAALTMRAVIVDGDVLSLLQDDGTINPVEAHRVRTPRNTTKNVVGGFLLDGRRKRLEVWITKEDLAPSAALYKVGETRAIPIRDADGARQVLHLYLPKRVSQTRGVSALAPIAYPLQYHDDLQFAHLVQAQIAACYAILREFPDVEGMGAGGGGGTDEQRGARTTDTYSDGASRLIEGLAPGMEITGRPGEKLSGFSPNIPNQEFFQHASLILTIIAVNLEIPVHVLLLDASKTNFSGWRGAVDQARVGMRELQRWLIRKLYRPVYLWKVRGWMATSAAYRALAMRDRGKADPFGHRWMPPSWPYIEPAKDAKADAEIIKGRLDSRRAVLGKRGIDVEEVDRAIVADNGSLIVRAIEKAAEINAVYPEAKLDWRELVHFAPAAGDTEPAEGDEADPAAGDGKKGTGDDDD